MTSTRDTQLDLMHKLNLRRDYVPVEYDKTRFPLRDILP